jgi:predicted nucleotidyltransferase
MESSSSKTTVRFINRDEVLADLRRAVAEAKAKRPEIARVFLFGSFVRGDWTADSDADLIVVVRKEFSDIFDRGNYAIFAKSIPTDSVVYSESEFEKLARDPMSFLSQNLPGAVEL